MKMLVNILKKAYGLGIQMKTSSASSPKGFLRPSCRSFVQIALMLLAGLTLHSIRARADMVFVWSKDGTLQKFSTNGVASLVSNNLSGWNGPVGLVCDNVGNLYAGVPGESTIWKFSPDGSRSASSASDIDSVSGLAFDHAGNLFITVPNYIAICRLTFYLGHGYVLFTPPGSTNYTQANLSYPISPAFDSAGNIYVANNTNAAPLGFPPSPYDNTIEKFASDFTYLGAFATGLNCPSGIAFDNDGNLFVANSGTNGSLKNTIVKFTTNGFRSTFATASSGLSGPQGLAFDSTGNLYVANSLNGTILKFTPNGSGSVFASGLNSPFSIAIFPGLKVWSATPIKLNNARTLPNGTFQFDLTENAGLTFTVLASTNVTFSSTNWTALGGVTEVAAGQFQFTDPEATNSRQRFYQIRSP
jgi:sugar lactone lactonase YvrE